MKRLIKPLICVLSAIFLLIVLFLGTLTVTEYRPASTETVSVNGSGSETLSPGKEFSVVTWNIGYAGLGSESDFFMDGGKNVAAADKSTVNAYLSGIAGYLESSPADFSLFQEVDLNSARTYGIDESAALSSGSTAFAYNFKAFVPYPIPVIGRVNGGLFTTSSADMETAERVSLPCPFSWPVRTVNLKRCLLACYIPIDGQQNYLVLVNLHLEAYDDGEGKTAQTKQLREFLLNEYEEGNYVIAGGDFNQVFPGSLDRYPNSHTDLWEPGILEGSMLPDGWSFAYDTTSPTCRLLNQPLNPDDTENTQYYVIDGFILSPNVTLNTVTTENLGFAWSDHNPVRISVSLQ